MDIPRLELAEQDLLRGGKLLIGEHTVSVQVVEFAEPSQQCVVIAIARGLGITGCQRRRGGADRPD